MVSIYPHGWPHKSRAVNHSASVLQPPPSLIAAFQLVTRRVKVLALFAGAACPHVALLYKKTFTIMDVI